MSGAVRLDLHVHGPDSPDSRLTLEGILDHLGEAGLQGFALTDHNTVRGHRPLAELAQRYPRYLLVPGVELSTPEGHVLAYGVSEVPPHDSIRAVVDWTHAHGGVVALAHPFRRVHGAGRRVTASAPVELLEARNGRNSEISNVRAELWAARRRLGSIGGSDAHDASDLGRAYTELPEPVASVGDVIELLRQRRSQAGGRSLPLVGRMRVGLRNAVLRAGRGFRAV